MGGWGLAIEHLLEVYIARAVPASGQRRAAELAQLQVLENKWEKSFGETASRSKRGAREL
jgi:hypothetical protein